MLTRQYKIVFISVTVVSAEDRVLMGEPTLVAAFERLLLLSVVPYSCGRDAVVLRCDSANILAPVGMYELARHF